MTPAGEGGAIAAGEVGGTGVVVELLRRASIEIAAGRAHALEALRGTFAPGSEVFVNFLPGGDYRPLIATAAALRRGGFEPVPHVAARNLENR